MKKLLISIPTLVISLFLMSCNKDGAYTKKEMLVGLWKLASVDGNDSLYNNTGTSYKWHFKRDFTFDNDTLTIHKVGYYLRWDWLSGGYVREDVDTLIKYKYIVTLEFMNTGNCCIYENYWDANGNYIKSREINTPWGYDPDDTYGQAVGINFQGDYLNFNSEVFPEASVCIYDSCIFPNKFSMYIQSINIGEILDKKVTFTKKE